jgi:hypothetical protein
VFNCGSVNSRPMEFAETMVIIFSPRPLTVIPKFQVYIQKSQTEAFKYILDSSLKGFAKT